jgi:hypothetical protein
MMQISIFSFQVSYGYVLIVDVFIVSEHRLLFGLSSRLSLWQQISNNLAVLINLLVGFFYPFSDGPGGMCP